MRILKNVWLWFLAMVCFVIVTTKGYETFFFRPCSAHQWRQSDGASYALNYYQHNLPFLPPQVHQRFAEDGRAVSEFPMVYYIAGQLYKIFGFHDYYIRLLHFSLFFIGLIFITRTAKLYTNNILLILFPAAFTITSPCLFYYGANFLPDVGALSLAMAGFYYFIRFDERPRFVHFLAAFMFFTLAALLKISSGILMVASIGFLIWNMVFNRSYFQRHTRNLKLFMFLVISLSLLSLLLWVQYDKYVAARYHYAGNLFGLLPIWDASMQDIKYIISRIWQLWLPAIWPKYVWLLFSGCILLVCYYFRKLDLLFRFFLPVVFAGVVMYFFAWFKTFDVHDYYMINMFCMPLLFLFAMIQLIEKSDWMERYSNLNKSLFVLVPMFLYASYKCRAEQIYRYYGKDYNTLNKSYYRLEPYLRSIGISQNDWVFSAPDLSPNITLYLMNNIGFTEWCNWEQFNINNIVANEPVKYLILGDSTYTHKMPYEPYCRPELKVGQFEGIVIYKIARQ